MNRRITPVTNPHDDPEFFEALTRVLDHFEQDEELNYDSTPEAEKENHIFLDICYLKGWVEAANQTRIRIVRKQS